MIVFIKIQMLPDINCGLLKSFQKGPLFVSKIFSVLKLESNALICLVLYCSTTCISCQKDHSSQYKAQKLKIPLHVYFKGYLT